MSEDNTIEYTIEENDNVNERIPDNLNERIPDNLNERIPDNPNIKRSGNGLSGLPQHVLEKLPQSFFGNEDIQHGDALQEFMLKHKASMEMSSNDGMNMHPSEYFKKIVMKEKND